MTARTSAVAVVLLVGALLVGCDDSVTVRGSFALDEGPEDTLFVWAVGVPQRRAVRDGRFLLEGVPAGPVDLRFGNGGEEVAGMRLHEVSARETVDLVGIHLDGETGLAVPEAVHLRRGSLAVVNGLRFGTPPQSDPDFEARGTVLATDPAARRILFRPRNGEMMIDLRVAIPEDAEVESEAGEGVALRHLAPEDTVWIRGALDWEGVVTATRLVMPQAAADRAEEERRAREQLRLQQQREREAREAREAERRRWPGIIWGEPPPPQREPPGRGRGRGPP